MADRGDAPRAIGAGSGGSDTKRHTGTSGLAPWQWWFGVCALTAISVAAAAGPLVALVAVVAGAVCAGLGAAFLHAAMGERASPWCPWLAFPTGLVLAGTACTLTIRHGGPGAMAPLAGLLVPLAALGVRLLRRSPGAHQTAPQPSVVDLLVLAVPLVAYGIPGGLFNAAPTGDGGLAWMHVDSAHHAMVVARIRTAWDGVWQPRQVGVVMAYHDAAYAIAAGLGQLSGLWSAGLLVRCVRPLAIVSAALAAAALAALAVAPGARRRASRWGPLGLWTLGGVVAGAVKLTSGRPLPWFVGQRGGLFEHALLGHSRLWGFVALSCALAVWLAAGLPRRASATPLAPPRSASLHWARWALLALLPALSLPWNAVVGFALFATWWWIGALELLQGRRSAALGMAVSLLAFIAAFLATQMAGRGGGGTPALVLDAHTGSAAYGLVPWLVVAIGPRLVGWSIVGAWVRAVWRARSDGLLALRDAMTTPTAVFAGVIAALVAFTVLMRSTLAAANDAYGLFFAECLSGVLAPAVVVAALSTARASLPRHAGDGQATGLSRGMVALLGDGLTAAATLLGAVVVLGAAPHLYHAGPRLQLLVALGACVGFWVVALALRRSLPGVGPASRWVRAVTVVALGTATFGSVLTGVADIAVWTRVVEPGPRDRHRGPVGLDGQQVLSARALAQHAAPEARWAAAGSWAAAGPHVGLVGVVAERSVLYAPAVYGNRHEGKINPTQQDARIIAAGDPPDAVRDALRRQQVDWVLAVGPAGIWQRPPAWANTVWSDGAGTSLIDVGEATARPPSSLP